MRGACLSASGQTRIASTVGHLSLICRNTGITSIHASSPQLSDLQRIVHVDDDESIRAITRVALERIGGFFLLSCTSGTDALHKVPAFSPQMILLDVMMPDMDGPTTLALLEQEMDLGKVLVVFMTAKVQALEIARYRALGACDVIIKPFDPMTLSERLQAIWIEHNVEQQ